MTDRLQWGAVGVVLSCFEPCTSYLSPRRWLTLARAYSLSSIPVGACSSLILPQNWGLCTSTGVLPSPRGSSFGSGGDMAIHLKVSFLSPLGLVWWD